MFSLYSRILFCGSVPSTTKVVRKPWGTISQFLVAFIAPFLVVGACFS